MRFSGAVAPTDPPDSWASASVTPDSVRPDSVTPDSVIPDSGTPELWTPGSRAPASRGTGARARSDHADRFRDATRAIADLRRGAAVIVRDGRDAIAVAAVETIESARLADLLGWIRPAAPWLVRPTALPADDGEPGFGASALSESDLNVDSLRRWADPAALLTPARDATPPAGPMATLTTAALRLVRLGHVLPLVVVAPVSPEALARAVADGAVVVDAADIVALRAAGARLVRVGEARLPLRDAAEARLIAFRNPDSGAEHVAVVVGQPERTDPAEPAPLVRLHSECFTGDVLGSLRCDCGPQLDAALRRMAREGAGVVLYLAQEGRGIGLLNKLRSYALQDSGLDTLDANAALGFAADERDFAIAAAMLRGLGVTRIRLLTNNPAKLAALAAGGIAVERAALLIASNGVNDRYLATKATRFGHLA